VTSSAEWPEPSRSRYRAVIVSPHLDDAVFSCAGTIARLVPEGPVLVINVFTRYLSKLKQRGVVMTEARHEEESAAASALGYESICLGELDAVFRRPEYESLGNIFRAPVATDVAWLPEFRARLLGLLSEIQFDELLVPMGVGWHVDHVLCFEALRHWQGPAAVRFYEDQPYALFAHATWLRLLETGQLPTSGLTADLASSAFGEAWRRTAAQYARSAMVRNLRPAPVRWLAVPVVAWYLRGLMRAHWPEGSRATGGRWRVEHSVAWVDLEMKVDAMALYRSQFREFFVDRHDCLMQLRAHASSQGVAGGAAERLWRLDPA